MVITRTQKINLRAHEIITKKRALLKQNKNKKKQLVCLDISFFVLFCNLFVLPTAGKISHCRFYGDLIFSFSAAGVSLSGLV